MDLFVFPVNCENIKDEVIPHPNIKFLAISVLTKTSLMLSGTLLAQPR